MLPQSASFFFPLGAAGGGPRRLLLRSSVGAAHQSYGGAIGWRHRRHHRSFMAASQSQQEQLALAREAREDAQWLSKPTHARLLQPPAHARLVGDTRHQPVLSVENWLHRRGWSAAAAESSVGGGTGVGGESIAAPGLRVLSHLLSYPLTLAHYLGHIAPAATSSPSSRGPPSTAALVMLGARAEASLPSLWWRELLCYHGSSRMQSLRLHVHMVGPELPGRSERGGGRESVNLSLSTEGQEEGAGGELVLYRHRGLYHELLSEDARVPAKPAAYVVFNPGFGHPNLSQEWKPTLDAALQQQPGATPSPLVVWTAHSEADKDRDVAFLDRHFGEGGSRVEWLLAPMPNPFASRKRVSGGTGEGKETVVQANMYVGVFRVQRL